MNNGKPSIPSTNMLRHYLPRKSFSQIHEQTQEMTYRSMQTNSQLCDTHSGLALILGNWNDKIIEAQIDVSFANEENRRSRTGALYYYYGNPVMAYSKAQKLMTVSTAETEYIGLNEGTLILIALRQYLRSINVKMHDPMTIY
jgi:hypothetical protein